MGGASTHPRSQRVRRRSQRAQGRSSRCLYSMIEDRGHHAGRRVPDPGTFFFFFSVPGSCLVLGDCSPLCGCSWVGSSHAPASHPSSLVAPCPPDPGSPARSIHVVDLSSVATLRPVPTLWRPTVSQTRFRRLNIHAVAMSHLAASQLCGL
jgi:hypothetical protein